MLSIILIFGSFFFFIWVVFFVFLAIFSLNSFFSLFFFLDAVVILSWVYAIFIFFIFFMLDSILDSFWHNVSLLVVDEGLLANNLGYGELEIGYMNFHYPSKEAIDLKVDCVNVSFKGKVLLYFLIFFLSRILFFITHIFWAPLFFFNVFWPNSFNSCYEFLKSALFCGFFETPNYSKFSSAINFWELFAAAMLLYLWYFYVFFDISVCSLYFFNFFNKDVYFYILLFMFLFTVYLVVTLFIIFFLFIWFIFSTCFFMKFWYTFLDLLPSIFIIFKWVFFIFIFFSFFYIFLFSIDLVNYVLGSFV